EQEVTVAVDSSGPAVPIAGVPARPYAVRAIGRFYSLERNVGGSIVFVRTLWMAANLPGVSPGAPRLQDSPARMMNSGFVTLQFMMFPMFRKALDQIDVEAARLPGNAMRDAFRVEVPPDSAAAGAAGPKSQEVYDDRVLEVRTEPVRPE